MTHSGQIFDALKKKDFITLADAESMGISAMTLSRLVASEKLYRTERGVYALEIDWLTHPLKKYLPICAHVPTAVVSGISALTFHGLTDEEERQIWITIPAKKKLRNAQVRTTRATGSNYTLGITRHRFGEHEVRIYDVEKCVVDSFKYLTEEVSMKALRIYLKRKDKNIAKLCEYGQKMRKPVDKYVKLLLSGE